MEFVHRERRIRREMSPDRAKIARIMRPSFKKVQVVYYLSRNGHLEHPHYIEVTHLAHQPLRLKDVMERLTVLRGKGMPSLYSWSCKRSYKNGYVWNDLAENDVIFPSEGAEYVLKGSELLLSNCNEPWISDKLHHLQINSDVQELHLVPKGKFLTSKQEEQEYEVKTEYTTCSRGVSTDEIQESKQKQTPKNTPNELILESNSFSSPPSTTSSSTLSDGDPVGNEPMLSRNSMLFSLIACGGSGSFRKNAPPGLPPCAAARKSCSGGNLHKGVVCKEAAAAAAAKEEEEMIRYMSENPRFGNLQAEEKEYFSGSIVERMNYEEKRTGVGNGLKRSSSYNQERSTEAGLGEVAEEEVKKEKGVKGKCIPRKKSSSKQLLKK
ncbi:hypothetical protein CDL12_09371 [Handroanthus impetiginosus]|uniref:SOSEKI DIX-like domain-containing protein n=1 Tax=Handroanthus impetiginosus TaxID=429701 RepID=A0A2G9HKA9_9LAMI|nr:hypothetical protein CDL12_09371 [Handroanthus impetiginosus]